MDYNDLGPSKHRKHLKGHSTYEESSEINMNEDDNIVVLIHKMNQKN